MSLNNHDAKHLCIVPVQNSRRSHLFMFDKKAKQLLVFNIEQETAEEELHVFTLDALNSERLVTTVPNFDFSPGVKYFLD